MNCSQARAMLAAYREIKNRQVDAVALERHLRSCAECKAFLAQGKLIGERLRALPEIELPADAHTKLMKALAVEHARFIHQSPASQQFIPVPVFLAPYLKEQGQEIPDHIAAFSTADTGPLPVIQMPRKRKSAHRSLKMSPFVVVGLAAAFLMTIMVGGLTSLVILTNHGAASVPKSVSVSQLSQISSTSYTSATSYTHIASAVGSRDTIYYTAYGNTNSEWMLAALDNQTKVSTPLLPQASINPLLVLSSSDNWLIWLRFDLPQQIVIKNAHTHKVISSYEGRAWSLEATYLGSDPASTFTTASPITLQKGIFDATAPSWVHTPIEGIWSGQNILLVTTLDKQGTSHLIRYTLDAEKSPRATELASAQNGHILTSPTATSNGTSIYWSEEWMDSNNVLHSNIWAQKISIAPLPLSGKWGHQASTDTYLFLADKASFHPQVVNDMLFLLDVKNATLPDVTTTNAIASSTPTATATSGAQSMTNTPDRFDTPFYTPLPDDALQGTLQAFSALDDSAIQLSINEVVQVPQGGTRFLLWQNSTRGIGMYDAVTKENVPVGLNPLPSDATLLAVNEGTTVWTTNNANNQSAQGATNAVTFGMFNWPTRAPIVS